MPNYDNFPIRGYSYDEPHGPRAGKSYRDPASDKRVLIGLIGLFVFGCVCVGLFGFMERKNTLTEYAFDDDRFACQVRNEIVTLELGMIVPDVVEFEPTISDASSVQLEATVRTVKGQDVLGVVVQEFDMTSVDWSNARHGFKLLQPLLDAPNQSTAICDIELTILD